MIELARKHTPVPRILVVGGGAVGGWMQAIYGDSGVEIVGTDVYASVHTTIVADGHMLPFKDGSFDIVIAQAVLEHVLEPQRVVDEIHRVLRPDGFVYAETPFIQQVHEGAYDFTRFTRSGHRWLFRRFHELEAISVGGAGGALMWSIRHYFLASGLSTKAALFLTLPFVPLRFMQRFARPQANADGALGHCFMGRRASEAVIRPVDLVDYYERIER
jgi:SAM-dependent methyltransferase